MTQAASYILASTRIAPPRRRADLLVRSRLSERVRAALDDGARLVLLTAPAGSGKTSLLLTALGDAPNAAWLSLDADDNHPGQFLYALSAAIERATPGCEGCAAEVAAILSGGASPAGAARAAVSLLVNRIAAGRHERAVLVLDDLHVVSEPAVHAALDALIERLPDRASVVVATRHDPPLALALLRARRELFELRLPELRFTAAEADALLNGRLGLGLDQSALEAIHRRTDGWAAGLSLLAVALERGDSAGARSGRLADSEGAAHEAFAFLADEVLDQEDPFTRMFLLETSVLPELTPAACRAVTGRDDAAAILDDLYRRNLFLVRVGADGALAAGAAYRYHDLFRDFLRARMEREAPEWRRALHRRAAGVAGSPSRQIYHLLQAAAWDDAVEAILRASDGLLEAGLSAQLRELIAALPGEALERHPRLRFLLGVCAWERWDLDAARMTLTQACAALAAAGDDAGEGQALAYLSVTASTMGDFELARRVAEQALERPLPPHQRVQVLLGQAYQHLAAGDWSAARDGLDAALETVERLADARALHVLAIHFHAPLAGVPGGTRRIETFCRLVRALAQPQHRAWHAAADAQQAFLALWRQRWGEARAAAEGALATSAELGGIMWVDFEVGLVPPLCDACDGDMAGAEAGFARVLRAVEQPEAAALAASWRAVPLFALGRTRWLAGDTAGAAAALAQMRAVVNPREWPVAPVLRAMLDGLLRLSAGDFAAAHAALAEALATQERLRATVAFGDARLLAAYAYLAANRPGDALAALAPALAEHEAEGTPGLIAIMGAPIVEPLLRLAIERGRHAPFAAQILARLRPGAESAPPPDPAAGLIPESGEALTPREVEVLRLIVAGASNAAIAEQYVLSIHTVKRHVANILQKLQVGSREEAGRRARALRII
jgi:LuxR family maltose regulon positive regulatory protein